jgi:glutamate racemase
MKKEGPIGVFDSGYGGLTVLKELRHQLPQYDFLYLGDNARSPYGTRSFEVVYQYTLEAVTELFARGCSLVILACNTASAKALKTIQQQDLPRIAPEKRVLGVIRPTTEILGEITQSKHIGILATAGTVHSNSYRLEIAKFSPEITVHQHACPMWVPLIENQQHQSEAGQMFIQEDVQKIVNMDDKMDVLVLACTHYPIVKEYIETLVPKHVRVLSQGKIVAQKLAIYLENHPEIEVNCAKNHQVHFLTTEKSSDFDKRASIFLEENVISEQIKL